MKLPLIFLAVFLMIYPVRHTEDIYSIENSKTQRTSIGKIDNTKKKEYQCLVSLLWYESRSEPLTGIKYVLSVVENRKNSSRYPDSYCKIMLQPKQFSFVHERLNKELSLEVIPEVAEKKKFDFIRKIAYDAVHGDFQSLLPNNVLHYTTTSVSNNWTRKKKVYKVEGKHKFYLTRND